MNEGCENDVHDCIWCNAVNWIICVYLESRVNWSCMSLAYLQVVHHNNCQSV